MIDFEQELYNRFGQIKDFTLGMRIAKYFYELGRSEIPKDQWSEEDEEMLEYVIGDVNDAKQLYTTKEAKDMADKEIAWLKSLRPQPKPEQPVCEELEKYASQIVAKLVPSLGQKYPDGRYVGGIRDYFSREELIGLVKAGAKWKMEQGELSCEGLEEEIERYLSTEWELDEDLNKDEPIYIYDCTWEDLKILARHFAKWQREQMKKSLLELAKEQHDHFHEREKDEIADGSNPDAIFFSGKCDAFKSLIDKLQSL